MAKKRGCLRTVIIAVLVVAIVGAAGAAWLWSEYGFLLKMRPSKPFALEAAPSAPDYDQDEAWAALPTTADEGDLLPNDASLIDAQADAPADVFFIHPTTFLAPEWNAPIDRSTRAFEGVERFVAGEASPFNGCCRVYAPLYRQATFYAFITEEADGPRALELAYSDIARAFKVFLDKYSRGRPFIVVGHSQGALHAFRLLRDEIDGRPVADRLVAAYAVGYPISAERWQRQYRRIGICDAPDAVGCMITWQTWETGSKPDYPHFGWDGDRAVRSTGSVESVCVNPLSWTADDTRAPAELHLGAVALPPMPTPDHLLRGLDHSGFKIDALPAPTPNLTSARCTPTSLEVDPLPNPPYRPMLVEGNYHPHDFTVFYMNIRANAQRRVEAWLAARTRRQTEL